MKLTELRELIRLVISEASRKPVHRVFDFDDTLVFTDAMVHINDKEGQYKKSMTPAEYAVYSAQDDDVFDYSDFNKLINPREVKWTVGILRSIINKNGPQGATILTDLNIPTVHLTSRGFINKINYKQKWSSRCNNFNCT
jgi:hypothetical protein